MYQNSRSPQRTGEPPRNSPRQGGGNYPPEPPRREERTGLGVVLVLIFVVVLLMAAVVFVAVQLLRRGSASAPMPGDLPRLVQTEPPTEAQTEPPTGAPTFPPTETAACAEPAAREATVPPEATTGWPETVPQEPQPPSQMATEPAGASVESQLYYVIPGIGELNIRSGPGTDYSEVGRIREGAAVTIQETAQSGSAVWGRMYRGWVNMNYLVAGTEPEQLSTGTDYRVKSSAGELNVRSGPGTDYDKVTRLRAGAVVSVTETQLSGATLWGHIAQGWICMDYMEPCDN